MVLCGLVEVAVGRDGRGLATGLGGHVFLIAACDFGMSSPLLVNQLAWSKVMKGWRQSTQSFAGSSCAAFVAQEAQRPYVSSVLGVGVPQSLQATSWQLEQRPSMRYRRGVSFPQLLQAE